MMIDKQKIPILRGNIKKGRHAYLFRGWCPYCMQFHIHGCGSLKSVEPERYLGFRFSHCFNTKSPFLKTGYKIAL